MRDAVGGMLLRSQSLQLGHTAPLRALLWASVMLCAPLGAVLVAQEPVAEDPAAPAQEVELSTGLLVRIQAPLVGNDDQTYKAILQRATQELARQRPANGEDRPLLVLEITPRQSDGGDGRGSNFERVLSLARFLVSDELAGVKTVAYIPQSLKGHAVLLAFACEEIAMAPDAEIGEAGVDEDVSRPIEPSVDGAYRQIAEARRTAPVAIARAMVDSRLEVLQVETDSGVDFVLREDLDELKQGRTVVEEKVLSPVGSLAIFTGREGRQLGFVRYLAGDRDALARVLRLSPEAVVEDQALLAEWDPVVIDITGPITRQVARRTTSLIANEIDRPGVNWIGLRIDSSGGDWQACVQLANEIAELESAEVRTVAYVPVEALGGAALVALACDQLIMQPEASVGGGLDEKPEVDEQDRAELDSVIGSLKGMADRTGHSWSLMAAMIDPSIELREYSNGESGEVRYFSPEEVKAREDSNQWRRGDVASPAGERLRLSADKAIEMGIAWRVANTFDEVNALYGFEESPRVAKPNWALELVEALASPGFATALLVIGLVGVYIELQTPGLGVGGFISVVAFLLFFWSHFLEGSANWLEVMLFLGGVAFLLLEVFVLPGVGVFGFGGGAMVLASLVLASQTHIVPMTTTEREQTIQSATIVIGAMAFFLATAFALRRFLPNTPIMRRMMLAPPAAEDRADLEAREAVADYSYLVGLQGTAVTNLFPAGRAEIDGEFVDVIAEGQAIERGAAIEVVNARANRVVVREVVA